MALTMLPRTGMQKLSRISYAIKPHTLPHSTRYLSPSCQHRTLWYSYHEDDSRSRQRRARIVYQHHHHPRCRHPRRVQKDQEEDSEWEPWGFQRRWAANGSKTVRAEDWPLNRHWNNLWNLQSTRARQRMEWIKKQIDTDPYAAIFGRRHKPLHFPQLEETFTTLWKSFLGLGSGPAKDDQKASPSPAKAEDHVKATNLRSDRTYHDLDKPHLYKNTVPPFSSPDVTGRNNAFEFDPISGRMVPTALATAPGKSTSSQKWPDGGHPDTRRLLGSLHENTKRNKERGVSYSPSVVNEHSDAKIMSLAKKARCERQLNLSDISNGTESSTVSAVDTPQDPTSPLEPQNNPIGTPYSPEIKYDVISSESPQSGSHIEVIEPNTDCESNISLQDERPDHANVGDVATPETLVAHSKQGFRLQRAGFLSRRDEDTPMATLDISSKQPMGFEEDSNLDMLRARDIRAAYEPRRSSIKSELKAEEAETNKGSNWSFEPNTTAASSSPHSELPAEHAGSTPISTEGSSKSAGIFQANERSHENMLQDEALNATITSISESTPAEVYRVFAYDPSSYQVIEAETLSSLQSSNEHLHPTEVLTRLANPAKFLPCLNKMRSEEYEIVSGGENILVFRKAPETRASYKGNSQVQESAIDSTEDESSEKIPEHLISGSRKGKKFFDTYNPHGEEARSQSNNVLRRMLIGGVATAGTCYAIGVVVEYFRTGGKDGWGVDGFTVFESDRRHREA
ncbi:hypothetical protein BJX64DRAFT_262864 [Aspergillus heterothallicus]